MPIERSRLAAFYLAAHLLLPAALVAQEFRATLTGRVTDPSGAVITGCVVQVKNVDTSEIATAKTDAAGRYTVSFLPPGNYSVTFEAAGFKKLIRDGLQLDVGQTAGVDVALELGAAAESVTVTAETPLLETEKADRGQVIDSQQVKEFPLNGRSPYLLAILSPGVNYNGEARFSRPFDLPHSWRVNGGLNQNNEFLLDGAPNNAQAGNNSVGLVPSVDAVQEFKVQTSSYDAQYGKTSGGIINVSLKGGTNTVHGTLYEFARRSAWDANTFALNAQGKPRSGHHLFESGGTVGGPVYLPKLYDGRDRTFFFFAYEDWRESTPETGFHSVPAPEFLSGDFSNLKDKNGNLIPIYDPTATHACGGPGEPCNLSPVYRNAFPGNRIPANRIHPIAKKILGFFPAPNTTDPTANFYSQNNFFRATPDRDRFHNWAIKFDQNIGQKQHIFVSGGHNYRNEFRAFNPVPPGQTGENAQDPLERINYVTTVDWVGTFSPTLVANVRIGYNRNVDAFNDLPNQDFDLTSLGFPASMVNQLRLPRSFGDYTFDNYSSLGRNFFGQFTNNYTIHPSITKVLKSHSIKTGLDFRLIVYNQQRPGEHNEFQLVGDRAWTRHRFNGDDSGVAANGNAMASFLLGIPGGINNDRGGADIQIFPSTVQRYYAPYIQDDWKVTRKLTLNLGLRLDFNVAPFERHNQINRGFDPNAVNPVDQMINHSIPGFGTLPTLRGSLLFAEVNGQPRTVSHLDATAIQPRFGFAYQMFPKLVWRGGFGRYYLNPNNDYIQFSGFDSHTSVNTSPDRGATLFSTGATPCDNTGPCAQMNNPFPSGVATPTGNSIGALTFLGRGFNFFDPNFHLPYVDQFSLGLQYQLPRHSTVDVSYIGSRGHKLESDRNFNEPDLALRQRCNPLEGGSPAFCDASFPNPFVGLPAFAGTSLGASPTITRWDLSRPFPEFGTVNQRGRNDGKTWYNSLQVNYRVRARGGLNLSVAYTLSKMIEQGLRSGNDSGFLDVQRNILNRSLVEDDQPHSLKIGSVWELPFGKGRKFFNTSSGFWSRIASGWEHTLILTYVSGRPEATPNSSNFNNVLYTRDAKLANIDWSQPIVQGWKPCVATLDPNFNLTKTTFWKDSVCGADPSGANFINLNFGSGAHNPRLTPFRDPSLRLQSAPSVDMSLNKTTPLTERASLQFRAEAFNLFNKFRYFRQGFNSNPTDSNFGTIVKANVGDGSNVGFPRHIQLALKLVF